MRVAAIVFMWRGWQAPNHKTVVLVRWQCDSCRTLSLIRPMTIGWISKNLLNFFGLPKSSEFSLDLKKTLIGFPKRKKLELFQLCFSKCFHRETPKDCGKVVIKSLLQKNSSFGNQPILEILSITNCSKLFGNPATYNWAFTSENCLLVTNWGATPFNIPSTDSFSKAWANISLKSCKWIHGNHWFPEPKGPPTPKKNGKKLFATIPPDRPKTNPETDGCSHRQLKISWGKYTKFGTLTPRKF